MQLVIVESPAKAKTIEKYLGPGFKVLASYGHIRDLPPKDGSVDPENGFEMLWDNYADKAKQLKAITDEAKKADGLILATDPDREGEAISWHVQEVLAKKKALPANVGRVTFNAITKQAVTDAMKHPRALDIDLIDAYRARRALDYLVGFTLSPVLWRKLPGAKSAGRVQSVALRLIVEREREIEAFRAQEYWSVKAAMEHKGQKFDARLTQYLGEKLDKMLRRVSSPSILLKQSRSRATHNRHLQHRHYSRKPRASLVFRPATPCGLRRGCMKMVRSPICVRTASKWTTAPFPPRAKQSLTALTAAIYLTNRGSTKPKPKTRKRPMKPFAQPISRRIRPVRAIMAVYMT
jgi:DNA topoisomerase IA